MIVHTVESDVWFLVNSDEVAPNRGLAMRDIVFKTSTTFGFIAGPTKIPGENEGLVFEQGALEVNGETFAIRKLQLFNDGVNVSILGSTTDAQLILDHVISFLKSIGIRDPITEPITFFVSRLSVDFDEKPDRLIHRFEAFEKFVSSRMGFQLPIQLEAINFKSRLADVPRRLQTVNPTNFRIERRGTAPDDKHRYFSLANTTTEKHIEILEELASLGE